MSIKQILKNFCYHYFLIYGMTIIVTFFWGLANGAESVSLDYLWKVMIFALVADLPVFVFWSRKELTSKQMLVRIIIHGILLEILLPTAGWFIGMWREISGFFIFFAVVLVVDASIFGITYLNMSILAGNINSALKKRKMEKEKKEKENSEFGKDYQDMQSE